jgi:hypothetical protein
MSDIRVKSELEASQKRRPGATTGFEAQLEGPRRSAVTPLGLMADFIDGAFVDGRLDDNELQGLRVLAGLRSAAPPAAAPTPQTAAPAPQTAAPAPTPAEATASPPTCDHGPSTGESDPSFMTRVADTLSQSRDLEASEWQVLDIAHRLSRATPDMQMSFLGALLDMMKDGDIDQQDDHEVARLDGFVDGLFALSGPRPTWGSAPHTRSIAQFLREALADNRLGEAELTALRALLDASRSASAPAPLPTPAPTPAATPIERPPRTDAVFEPAPDWATTNRSSAWYQRLQNQIDKIVRSGGLAEDLGANVKNRLRSYDESR